MSQYNFFVLTVFVFLLYLIVTDLSVATFVNFLFGKIKFEYEKRKWWIWNNPKTPWARYIMWRRCLRLAKELDHELEMERKRNQLSDNSKTSE